MPVTTPRFLLISDADRSATAARWRFVLQPLEAGDAAPVEAADTEPAVHGERLELLAAVRGLEALSQPSKVTLLTTSRYVSRGLHYGLAEWRSNGWQWEHFGSMMPVKNCDLWQRLDRALEYHEVDCRLLRFDMAQALAGDATPADHDTHEQARLTSNLQGPHFLRRGARTPGANAYGSLIAYGSANAIGAPVVISNLKSQISNRASDGPRAKQRKTFVFKSLNFARIWRQLVSTFRRRRAKLRRQLTQQIETCWLRLRQLGTGLTPPPWFDG
jgi:ribonuclease HI